MADLSDEDEREAQRIACSHLITGCEDAVSELLHKMDDAEERSPAVLRAREILARVLSSWRDTLQALSVPQEVAS